MDSDSDSSLSSLSLDDVEIHEEVPQYVGLHNTPAQKQGHSGDLTCASRAPFDGGSGPAGSRSLTDSGRPLAASHRTPQACTSNDLEMDFMPSQPAPPSYDAVVSGEAEASPRLNSRLRGPTSVDPNPRSQQRSTGAAAGSSRQSGAAESGSSNRSSGATQRTTTRTRASRTKPRARGMESCPPVSGGARVESLTVDLVPSLSSQASSSRTNGSLTNGKLDLKSHPGTTIVTTNGAAGPHTVTVTGNVVINNTIDRRGAGPSTRTRSQLQQKQKKPGLKPLPAQGSKRRITSADIEILSGVLGNRWFDIGLSIGVDRGMLENIRLKYERDQEEMARQMLVKWTHIFGRKATINYVVDALMDKKFDMYEVARKLPAD